MNGRTPMTHRTHIGRVLTGVLAALMLTIVGVATPALAEVKTVDSYSALSDALNSENEDSANIVLDSSFSDKSAVALTVKKTHILDLNGVTLSLGENSITLDSSASLTLINGEITFNGNAGIVMTAATDKLGTMLSISSGAIVDLSNSEISLDVTAGSNSGNGSVLDVAAGGHLITGSKGIKACAGTDDNSAAINIAGSVSGNGSLVTVKSGEDNTSSITINDGAKVSVNITNDGALQINGGEVTGKIANIGTLQVDGGKVTGTVTNSGTMTVNDGTFGEIDNTGTMEIKDGTFGNINNGDEANLTISDGEFTGNIVNEGTLTINDGEFKGNITNQDNLTITNGYFAGRVESGGKDAKFNITGGDFDYQPPSYAPFAAKITKNNRTYYINTSEADDLQKLIDEAELGTKDEITLVNANGGEGEWSITMPIGVSFDMPGNVGRYVYLVELDANKGSWEDADTVYIVMGMTTNTKGIALDVPSGLTNPGYVFMGWYVQERDRTWTAQDMEHVVNDDDYTIYAQWAAINATITPDESTVVPGTEVELTVSAKLEPVTAGIELPKDLAIPTPILTCKPESIDADYDKGAITFRAPASQGDIELFLSYADGTEEIGSGYAEAIVHVVDKGNIRTAVNPAGSGMVASVDNANGTMTLTATANVGYEFSHWTFTPDQGVARPTGIDYNQNPIVIPADLAGVWTAYFVPTSQTVSITRLWNPYTGAHLLSSDLHEVSVLTGLGWRYEGVKFTQFGDGTGDRVGITRLYNRYNGDHFYTARRSEIEGLSAAGWTNEGVKFYGPATGGTPVYRVWNQLQLADGGLGSHMWTADYNEYMTLPTIPPVNAWVQEGIAWNAVQAYL